MSDVEHTYVDTNNGLGGPALGAGFGGLIGSWFGQGMNGGWGNNGNNWANNTFLANQMSAIQSQAVANGLATQQAVNSAAQTTTEAINSNGRDTNNAIYQSNLANVQGQGATQLGIANTGANLTQGIMALGANLSQALAGINQNITNQGYENRLSQQQLALQLTQQHNELLKAIDKEGCANRELQRQIQTEYIAGALADAKSKVNILEQTQSIVSQLKTTGTAG
jgi:hypothetical protein